MKYFADFKVSTRYIAEIEADSLEEAKKEAECMLSGANFGSDVEIEMIGIKDSDDNFVYEKEA